MAERLGILISGSGTTAAALAEACESHNVQLELACIIASNPEAGAALGDLRNKMVVVNPKDFLNAEGKTDQTKFGEALLGQLLAAHVQVVSQNGWLPLTPLSVIDAYSNAIFNQHPGPKLETRGTRGRQPLAIMLLLAAAGYPMRTEMIVHRVTEKFDDGDLIGRRRVFFPELAGQLKELQEVVKDAEAKKLSPDEFATALPLDPLVDQLKVKTLKAEHILVVAMMHNYAQLGQRLPNMQRQPSDQNWSIKYGEQVKLARARARKQYPNG